MTVMSGPPKRLTVFSKPVDQTTRFRLYKVYA